MAESNNVETGAIDEEAIAAYDLKDLSAPRVSGIAAKVLLFAAQNRFIAPVLGRKILSDSGFIAFYERIEISSERERYPLHFPLPKSAVTPLLFSDIDKCFQHIWDKSTQQSTKRHSVRHYYAAYQSGLISPIHVCEAALQLIRASNNTNPPLNAITALNDQLSRAEAALSAERWRTGCPISVLDGVPLVVKDMITVQDYPTTAGLGYLVLSPPTVDRSDAAIVSALRKAGMIIVGKTNTDEIGMGVRGFNRYLGQSRNPWDPNRVPGGSSGGSAAAVAAALAPIALGSDGGGSVRIPAACCGVFGLKPTFARLSVRGRFWDDGSIPDNPPPTMCAGPLALCADDLALSYFVLAAYAPHGPIRDHPRFGAPLPILPDSLDGGVTGLRVGICKPWVENTSPSALIHFRRAVSALEDAGAIVCPIVIPLLEDIRCAHAIAISSNTVKELQRNGGMEDENWSLVGLDTRLKMILAAKFDEDYIAKADTLRTKVVHETVKVLFEQVDIVLTPAMGIDVPEVPANLDTGLIDSTTDSQMMRFMTFANLTGVPAASIPVGIDETNSLPYSVQVIAGPWQEVLLLQMAKFFENCLSPETEGPPTSFDVLGVAERLKSQEPQTEDAK